MSEYKIRTLADLWALPTSEMMDRALDELRAVMGTTRRMGELTEEVARALASKDGKEWPAGRLVSCPDEIVWRDDHGVPSEVRFGKPDGTDKLMTVHHGEDDDTTTEGILKALDMLLDADRRHNRAESPTVPASDAANVNKSL